MNKKLIIQDINRQKISLNALKKSLFIDDDITLMYLLVEVVELGLSKLNPLIVRDNFMYIIYSMQYLRSLKQKHPEIEIPTDKWQKQLKSMTKNVKKNPTYFHFINGILKQVNFIPAKLKSNKINEPKNAKLKNDINAIINNSNTNDMESIRKVTYEYIKNYISTNTQMDPYQLLNQVSYTLKNKIVNVKNNNEKIIIGQMIKAVDVYYAEYNEFMVQKYAELFRKYANTQYQEEVQIIPTPNEVEENQPFILTIDDPYSLDLDDALAVSEDEFGMTLHVYISNTNPFLVYNPRYEAIAFEKYTSLYYLMHEQQKSYHMLPKDYAENILSLVENQVRSVIDHSFYIDYFGNVSHHMSYKNIIVNKRLSYAEVDEMIRQKSESPMGDYLHTIEKCIQLVYKNAKLDKKYVPFDGSRAQKLVASSAILVNHMTAAQAIKNQYLLLYQDYFSGKYSASIPENAYAKVTSPIRRYGDLKNNYLLSRFLEGNISDSEYYTIEQELQNMIPVLEEKRERNKQFTKIGILQLSRKI